MRRRAGPAQDRARPPRAPPSATWIAGGMLRNERVGPGGGAITPGVCLAARAGRPDLAPPRAGWYTGA
jgi:hypothetical protein